MDISWGERERRGEERRCTAPENVYWYIHESAIDDADGRTSTEANNRAKGTNFLGGAHSKYRLTWCVFRVLGDKSCFELKLDLCARKFLRQLEVAGPCGSGGYVALESSSPTPVNSFPSVSRLPCCMYVCV